MARRRAFHNCDRDVVSVDTVHAGEHTHHPPASSHRRAIGEGRREQAEIPYLKSAYLESFRQSFLIRQSFRGSFATRFHARSPAAKRLNGTLS